MNGSSWTGTRFERLTSSSAVQTIYLLLLGLLAVLLHINFRIPLQLHGRHGMELMAIFLLGRLSVDRPWSGSMVGLGAAGASLLPFWSFRDPLMPLLFLLPGVIVDVVFRYQVSWQRSWWFLGLLGGVAYMTKPLIRGAAAASLGLKYGFLRDGLLYVVALHFIFGAIGGLLSFLYVLGTKDRQEESQ